MFNHSHIRHFSSVFVSLRDFELITQNSSENITSRQSRCIYVNHINTKGWQVNTNLNTRTKFKPQKNLQKDFDIHLKTYTY